MNFGVPVLWAEPIEHIEDECYVCCNYKFGQKRTRKQEYRGTKWVQLPLPHSYNIPVPKKPNPSIALTYETESVDNEAQHSQYQPSNIVPNCGHEEFSQDDFNNVVKEMKLSQRNSILLASKLRAKKLLGTGTHVYAARGRQQYDLLDAVKIPFQDPKTQYIDEDGHDGFPAFGFKLGSDVKIAHRQLLPDKLPAEFSILISAKPRSRRAGFIFAVVNPYDTVVELGVKVTPEGTTSTILSLFYTNATEISSQSIANFTVNRFYGKWTRFAFKISIENVTLYFNCNETETVAIKKEPLELIFDSASTLYIAQAGPTLSEPYEQAVRSRSRQSAFSSERCDATTRPVATLL
ncbi:unnamed protein product [Brassicogethes aeneus]|uniref:Thrombospondin-like N-terminal domain-containing protein n=1 Tax=Brassicogethes aeneus TaxID=1431903 RepID=A0A9P0AS19_BRAAE|nr:unnamed protein product [Brassicogethes aeneus]